jgi:hypothetical protein
MHCSRLRDRWKVSAAEGAHISLHQMGQGQRGSLEVVDDFLGPGSGLGVAGLVEAIPSQVIVHSAATFLGLMSLAAPKLSDP